MPIRLPVLLPGDFVERVRDGAAESATMRLLALFRTASRSRPAD